MATVTREPIQNLHDKLVVKVSKEDYFPSFEKSLKNYGKNIALPGFRKGNVPSSLVKKMYGNSIFVEEVLRTANTEIDKYLNTEKPEIFAQPIPLADSALLFDFNNPQDYTFQFEIGLKPSFEVEALKEKGKFTRHNISITEKMLDDEVVNIQKRAGKLENPDTLEEDTDIMYLTYEVSDADGNVVENAEKIDDVASLERFPKKLGADLKGKEAGYSLVFQPAAVTEGEELADFLKTSLKKDAESKEEAEKTYKLTLTKVGRIEPRELNKDLYEEVFPNQGIEDEAAFRAKLKEELGKETSRFSKDRLNNDIFETLVHETKMELPVSFLKTWMKKGGETEKSDEDVEKEYPSFEHQLRWTLISDKLMGENEVSVSMDEVKEEAASKVLQYFGISNKEDAPWIDTYLEKMLKDENTVNETYRQLMFNKLFDSIVEKLELKEDEVTAEEFGKLAPLHQHDDQ